MFLLIASIVGVLAQGNLPPPVLFARFALDGDTKDSEDDVLGEAVMVAFADASECKIGQCAEFAGDAATIELPPEFDLPTRGGGFMAWVFVDEVVTGVNARVVSKASGPGFGSTHFQIALEDSLNWRLRVMTTDPNEPVVQRTYMQANAKPVLREWQHIAASVSKDTVKFYVNGVIILNAVVQLGGSGAYVPNSDVPFVIGNNRVGDDEQFRGKIDDVRFYRVEVDGQDFSQTFVSSVFNDVPPPTPAAPPPTLPPPPTNATTTAIANATTSANATTAPSGAQSKLPPPSSADALTIAVAVSAVVLVLLVIVLVVLVVRSRRAKAASPPPVAPSPAAPDFVAGQYLSVPRSPSQKALAVGGESGRNVYDHVPAAETAYITLPS